MICESAKLYHQLQTIPEDEIPILVPVFNLVSYAKFMANQLKARQLNNFIICDNASTYKPMHEYLDELSKTERVVKFDQNLGPRIFTERQEFLSVLPEYFIVSDPDLIFNEELPKNFMKKMKRIIDMYNVSKAGFAISIEKNSDRFYDELAVRRNEQHSWSVPVNTYEEKDQLYVARIDTTFCMHKKSKLIRELPNAISVCNTSGIRIAGRFTCEHMGWWKDQPITDEEKSAYESENRWGSTQLGYVPISGVER